MARYYHVGNIGNYLARRDDGWVCHYCHTPLKRDDNATVDHKTPLSRGGDDHPSNLVLCCRPCNEEKGDWDYVFFRALTRNRRIHQSRPDKSQAVDNHFTR